MNWEPETADPKVGSFMPGLEWAVRHTYGPVLELGAGYFSTPFIAGLAPARLVMSYEYDPEWAAEIRKRFILPVFERFDALSPIHWDVVLVDCEGWNRLPFFTALRPRTNIFVIHDSQDPWIPDDVLEEFQYRKDFDENPRTTLVSSIIDVGWMGE